MLVVQSRRFHFDLSAYCSLLPAYAARTLAVGAVLAVLFTVPATAQKVLLPAARDRVGKVDERQRVVLRGHVPPLARAEFDQGVVDDNLSVERLIVVLQRSPEQDSAAAVLIDQLHNPHSPSFRQWLTPEEFGRRFGPTDNDLAKLTVWLQSKGFRIDDIPAGRTHVVISGTARQLREAFGVQLHHLQVRGEAHLAARNEPQIPATLATLVAGFRQLHDWHAKPQHHSAGFFRHDTQKGAWQRTSGPASVPDLTFTNGPSWYYPVGPQDWHTIYNSEPLYQAGITGAGVTIAVLEQTQVVNPSDVDSFRSQFRLPAYPSTPSNTQGGVNWIIGPGDGCSAPLKPTSTGEEAEALLDVQWAGAVAPNATIDFVACSSTGSGVGSEGIDLAASYVANHLYSTVVATSLSYGGCETDFGPAGTLFYSNLWQQMAAEGITAVVSSGDSGSLGCDLGDYGRHDPSTNALSSSPYNISAGGTDFSDYYQTAGYTRSSNEWWNTYNDQGYSTARSYVPEMSWGSDCANPPVVSYSQYWNYPRYSGSTPLQLCNSEGASVDQIVFPVGGGGGVSQYNPIPSWQTGVFGIGNAGTSTTNRNEPDLSFFASNGRWNHFLPYCQSDTGYTCDFTDYHNALALGAGGTSFVAPQIAGLMALINQQTGARQGVANYTLYSLAANEYGTPSAANDNNLSNCSGSGKGAAVGSSCIFRDIANDTPSLQGGTITSDIVQPCRYSTVTNFNTCYRTDESQIYGLSTRGDQDATLAYQTAPGYDLATGLGSVNVYNLVMAWNSGDKYQTATSLSVSPDAILSPAATLTLTGTVVATGRGGQVAPVGTMSFYLDSTSGKLLGTSNLSAACSGSAANTVCSAQAELVVQGSQLNPGANAIVSYFPGDGANDAPSTSEPVYVSYGSAPDLTVSNAHIGNFVQGQTGIYMLVVSNVSGAPATGTVTVTDSLPAGVTPTAISGAGWACTLSTVSCTRSDSLAGFSSYPAITLTVSITAAPGTARSTATVSGGDDINPGNNSAVDVTTVLPGPPDLVIAKSHTGSLLQGRTGNYTLLVSNVGGTPSNGTVTVNDSLPGPLAAIAISGTGWTCTLNPLGCNRSESLNPGDSYSPISVIVSVPITASGTVTNTATVAGGNDSNSANNTASDITTIVSPFSVATITTIAGNGGKGYTGDGGPATSTQLNTPEGVTVDAAGNLYIADFGNSRIRKVDPVTGTVTTVAGNGTATYSGDGGLAVNAGLHYPTAVAFDSFGNMYIADEFNNCIRKVNLSSGIITTVAGTGTSGYSGDGGPAINARLTLPTGVAVDAVGNLYIADGSNGRIRRVDATTGIIITVAGIGGSGFSGDGGPATAAKFNYPEGIALDRTGNLYITDSGNNRVRKVSASTGIITTVAGTGTSGYSGDGGPALSAKLSSPFAVAVDLTGNLYIADRYNYRVREVDATTGIIQTAAGNGTSSYGGDGGPATSAMLSYPVSVAVDASGNLFIADMNNHRIRKVAVPPYDRATTATALSLSGEVTAPVSPVTFTATVSTSGTQAPLGYVVFYDGSSAIRSVPVNSSGNAACTISNLPLGAHSISAAYSGDPYNLPSASPSLSEVIAGPAPVPVLTSISPNNAYVVTSGFTLVVKGSGFVSTSQVMWNGSARPTTYLDDTQVWAAISVADVATAGMVTVTVSTPAPGGGNSNGLPFSIQPAGIIATVIGNGTQGFSGDGGPASLAQLGYPNGMAMDAAGNIYFAERANNRVRKVNFATGVITTVAGNGSSGYSGDGGLATNAALKIPSAVAVDSAGNLYIADSMNHRIRKVSASTGIITTFAGTGTGGLGGDRLPPTSTMLNDPMGLALDTAGNLHVADTGNGYIRKVNVAAPGVMTIVAGNGTSGYSGDGGPATSAALKSPSAVAVDAVGNVYIADSSNNRIRKVDTATKVISTVAGTGIGGYNGDGVLSINAPIYYPLGVAVDSAGNLYISDSSNYRVRKVDAATGVITTIAGNGTSGYSGDGGPAVLAQLGQPNATLLDPAGNLYIADITNQRIREIVSRTSPTITWTPPASIPYGTDLSAFLNATATANGNPVPGTFSYVADGNAINSASILAAGSHVIVATFMPNDTAFYTGKVSSFSLTVTPATLVVTAENRSMTYSGTVLLQFAFQYRGFVSGEDASVITTPPTCSTMATSSSAVGTYSITCSGGVASNYTFTYVAGTLTVNPVALIITATDRAKSYGQNLIFAGTEFTTSGLLNNDTVSTVTLTSSGAEANASLGTYPIVPSAAQGAGIGNYTIEYVNATLTVSPAPLTVTANLHSKVYGSPDPQLTYQITGGALVNGDSLSGNLQRVSGEEVGSYAITQGTLTAGGNYSLTFIGSTLTISPAPAVVSLNNLNQTYAGVPESATISILPQVSYLVTYTGTDGAVYGASGPTNPGTYHVSVVVTDSNYTGGAIGTLTINQLDPGLTLALQTGSPEPSPYGTRMYFELSTANSVTCPTGNVNFYVDYQDVSSQPAASVVLDSATRPDCSVPVEFQIATLTTGTHTITAVYSGDTYYPSQTSNPVLHAVVANGTEVTLAVSQQTINVGDGVTFTATVNPSPVTGSFAVDPAGSVNFNEVDGAGNFISTLNDPPIILSGPTAVFTTHSLPAGPHNIQAVFTDSDGQFQGSSSTVAVATVNLRTPVINWRPDVAMITYGTALGDGQLNATASDPETGASVSGTWTYVPAAGAIQAVGSVNLQGSFTPSDGAMYAANSASTTITVTAATLTVTADSQNMKYGDPVPLLSYTITGFQNGDGASVISGTPNVSTTATSSSNTGVYPITVDLSSLASANYKFVAVSGAFTIESATQSVVLTCPAATYDGTAKFCSVSGIGACTINGDGQVNAGTYPVTVSCTGDANHNSGATNSSLLISKASQSITLTCTAATYDGTAKSCSVIGIGACIITGDGQANAGTYPVIASCAGDANHNSGTTNSSLVISKAAQSPVLSCPTVVYDGAPHSCTATGGFGCSISPASATAVGTYSVTAMCGDVNHLAASASGTLKIVAPVYSVSPTSLSFGKIKVGSTSSTKIVTLTNKGSIPNPVGVVQASGDFHITQNTCPSSLNPNASCQIGVSFVPKVIAAESGTLTIGGFGASIPLTGTGSR